MWIQLKFPISKHSIRARFGSAVKTGLIEWNDLLSQIKSVRNTKQIFLSKSHRAFTSIAIKRA